MSSGVTPTNEKFQSTLSMRRATVKAGNVVQILVISIHALHEESDPYLHAVVEGVPISIHALHEESDMMCWTCR